MYADVVAWSCSRVEKSTTSKYAWKILEAEFGERGSNQVEDNSVVQIVVAVLEYENEDGFVVANLQKYEEFGESHLKVDHNVDGVLRAGANFGIDNVANGKETDLVDLAIEIVDVNFDKEEFTNDEWLDMIQQKHLIDRLLFGERIPLAS